MDDQFRVRLSGVVHDASRGEVLLVRVRDEEGAQLNWAFPSTFLEYGVSPTLCLERALLLLTHLHVRANAFLFVQVSPFDSDELLVYFNCELIKGTLPAATSVFEARWFSTEEAALFFISNSDVHQQLMLFARADSSSGRDFGGDVNAVKDG